MAGIEHTFVNDILMPVANLFGAGKAFASLGTKAVGLPKTSTVQAALGKGTVAAPQVPNTDTAAMASAQQQQQLARQRGVLATIYAGNNAQAPTVATKTLLGA